MLKKNKENSNIVFQILNQDETGLRKSIEGSNEPTFNIRNSVVCQMGLLSACLLLITYALYRSIGPLVELPWTPHKSTWRTSAHVQVYTYSYLARLAPHHSGALTGDRTDTQSDKVVSCYYNLPSETERNQLLPGNIQPHLCTHLNVAFARIVNKEITLEPNQYKSLQDLGKLKQDNPKLKILLSVGGAGNDNGFSDMVADHASRKIFIKSIKSILRNYTLDGIDLDWEFPALHRLAARRRERQHFSQLLREIRMEYIREKRDYILTIAAPAPETIINISYDIDQVNLYVDFVNIMTYDYHFYTKYTPFTGLNSPLYPRSSEQLYLATLNINYTVQVYLEKGLDRNKIVVGIPTYGHTFSLVNSNNTRIGSPASGFGTLSSSGFINYPDICALLRSVSDVTIAQDAAARVPYLYRNNDWVSYDSPDSVAEKAKFIREHNLRGAMIYSLNADDYAGVCAAGAGAGAGAAEGAGLFPLAQSVKRALVFNDSEVTTNQINW